MKRAQRTVCWTTGETFCSSRPGAGRSRPRFSERLASTRGALVATAAEQRPLQTDQPAGSVLSRRTNPIVLGGAGRSRQVQKRLLRAVVVIIIIIISTLQTHLSPLQLHHLQSLKNTCTSSILYKSMIQNKAFHCVAYSCHVLSVNMFS